MTQITDRDHELYNKAVTNDWDGRQMLLAIAASREEGRQEERARRLAWYIKFSEQPISEALMAKAEEKPVSIRDAVSLGWASVLHALHAELIREKRGEVTK